MIVIVLALLFGILSVALSPRQAHAASRGCEHNPVNINRSAYYACITTAQPCLHVRDLISFAITECLPYHTTIYVYGQYTWSAHVAAGSDIWDGIRGGGVVSDTYVNTSNLMHFPLRPLLVRSLEDLDGLEEVVRDTATRVGAK